MPGIYHEKEQAAARAFGFPQFHRVMDAELELSAEEKNTFDEFWILVSTDLEEISIIKNEFYLEV